jgi:murein DD-endopeptidase MepM/ murein hydrolase activator NlpD
MRPRRQCSQELRLTLAADALFPPVSPHPTVATERRFSIVVRTRTGEAEHWTSWITLRGRGLAILACVLAASPALVNFGAKWIARLEVRRLNASHEALRLENGNYRATTNELKSQIQALENVIDELGGRAASSPVERRAMKKLPAVVKASAAGSNAQASAALSTVLSSLSSPEDTFGVLRDLLQGLENRLLNLRGAVERQEKLAAATPSIWPASGWLSSSFGGRSDPMTGEPAFHQGIDISTEKGRPVYATADGTVESASNSGDYGKLVVLRHNFGLTTRYGHLSVFNVKPGAPVKRGDVIGFVGSTGRSTGSHLHYEILANDKLLDPLQLLTQRSDR